MSAAYPGAVKTFTTKNAGDVIQPVDVNDLQDEVNAIEDGLLNGKATLNSSNSTLRALSVTAGSTLTTLQVTGNSTFGSTVTFGTVGYIFPASAPTSSGQALMVSSTGTPNTLVWGTPGAVSLLKAGSGTSSAAGATTVDSIAISGLTANDTLLVIFEIESATQTTGFAVHKMLYNATDAVAIIDGAGSGLNLGAGIQAAGKVIIRQRQSGATAIAAQAASNRSDGLTTPYMRVAAFTTNWTGAWTLALRHEGVTAGGTFSYVWSVYKMAGQ